MQFKAYSELAEVNGETAYTVIDGLGVFKDKAITILERNGIVDPKSGMWFNQQNWLNSLKDISDNFGDRILYSIGLSIPIHSIFPPGIDEIEEALAAVDSAYHGNHRNGEIGHYLFEKTGDKSGKMICENPYPCVFDLGIIDALVKKFLKNGTSVVRHDNNSPCRKNGAESCTYLISW